MSVHRVHRRHALVLMGLLATVGVTVTFAAALGWPALAETTLAVPPPADRVNEAAPMLHNEPLIDPRAERVNRVESQQGDTFLVPYGIERGVCDRRQLANDAFGGVVGLVGGVAATEAVVTAGRSKAPYVVAGAATGPLVGPRLARAMDDVDHHCVGRTLEYAPDNHRVRWQSDTNGAAYVVVPVRTFQNPSGLYCREYVASVTVAGKAQETLASACRAANGTWKLLRSD
jgi:surface antigen